MPATRFVCDASLEGAARRLRMLGHDVATHRGARLEELFEASAREGRTVLTLSARHPRRYAQVPCVRLSADVAAAVRAIDAAFEAASPPFRRCPECNTPLQVRSRFEARGEVPGRVTRAGGPLTHCPGCGRWYWLGSHVTRLLAWFATTLGRQVVPPGEAPSPSS